MKLLNQTLNRIGEINQEALKKADERVNNLIKPMGSLGKLEEIAVKLSGITGELYPDVTKRSIIVMAADNGVCEEGVATGLQEVTKIQAINMTNGYTGVSALSKQAKANLVVVDIGIKTELENCKILNKKVMFGTNNMRKTAAMTREQAIKAIEVGIEVAEEEIKKGARLLGTGEMGIGNTTPSTAILSVVAGYKPEEITGMGANLPEDKISHKARVIRDAIKLNKPNKEDIIDVLSKVGSLDIAGMAGVMIAGAANRVPVVVDGYISTISAIVACSLNSNVKDYLFSSHSSLEKGAIYATEYLGFKPVLNMEMRLGEGTGAALMFNVIEAATFMNKHMLTFEEGNIAPV